MVDVSRRTYLSLAGAGLSGFGSYAAFTYARGWEPEDCGIDGHWTLQDAPAEGTFSTYHGDFAHTGHVESTTTVDSRTECWRTDLGAMPTPRSLRDGPVVADGRVYVTAPWGVYAIDQRDGSLAWCTGAGRTVMTGATVADETVVIGTVLEDGKGGLMAFDAADGTRRWRSPKKGLFSSKVGRPMSSPTVHGSTVFVGGQQRSKLSAIDLGSGNLQWRTDVGGSAVVSPAVDDDGVYVHRNGALVGIDPRDGTVNWKSDAGETDRPPTLAHGLVYSRTGNESVGAWDVTSGERRWTSDALPDEPRSICVAHGDLYVLTSETLHVLDARDGQERWTRAASDLHLTVGSAEVDSVGFRNALVTDDRLYLTISDGLVALRRDDGAIDWYTFFYSTERDGDAVVPGRPGSPAIAGGTVFVTTLAGWLYAFES